MVKRAGAIKNRCMPSTNAPKLTLKHGIDRVIAFLVLVVLAPLMIAIVVAVRLSSPGPVLFRQRRVGRGGREFDLYKFRTMRNEPGEAPFELAAGLAPGGVEGSDRRTWIGRWLRASSLDELPQFLNVLRGEMSIIGPRPERPDYAKRFALTVPGYIDRLRVNAGITGWAQANGLRGQTPIADRVVYDNYYIDHWSLRLELRTVALTAVEVLRFRDRPARPAALRPATSAPARAVPDAV
jgi:lipopolysaccharide/colanic/teichoic acid biosynthesis glycosyltransferase